MTKVELVQIDRSGKPAAELGQLPGMVATNCGLTAAFYRVVGFEPPWIGYLSVLDGCIVGGGGFKGSPKDNKVEIAYYTLPHLEGRGIATATARGLVAIARSCRPGLVIVAQTLPATNASTAVLQKIGFALAGTVIHPEDGEVWEWHLNAEQ